MSVHSKLPDECSKPSKSMGHRLDFKGSSWREQSSTTTKDKLPSFKSQKSLRLPDKSEVLGPFAQPYIDRRNNPKRQTDDDNVVQLASSGSFRKQQVISKADKEVEIVRHMKNLPSYLHPVEKPKNVQDRALNFGVLDWRRLEKWKDNDQMPGRGECRASCRVSETPVPYAKEKAKRVKSTSGETMRNCGQEKVKHVKDSQYPGIGSVAGLQTDLSQQLKASGSCREIKSDNGKRTEGDQKMTTQKADKHSFGLSSIPTSDLQGGNSTGHNDSSKLCPKYSNDEPQNIVLLVPKVSRRSSSKDHQLSESRRSHDGKLVENSQKKYPHHYLPQELQSGEYPDVVPRSYPLPANVSIAQDLHSDVCTSFVKNDMPRSSDARISNVDYSVSIDTTEAKDSGTLEKPAVKSRPESPSRRFSFNLGKLGRSFSFRESSTVSKEKSKSMGANSGPISSEVLSGVVDHDRENAHISRSTGWSSSFRKILDPVLRPKGAHSAQAGHRNLVAPEPTYANKVVHDERRQASMQQALVQLTFKDRLPFFKFIADDSPNILAAAVKDLPTCERKDSFSYGFYSVSEIKKKTSSWMSHGSKDKNFEHTTVGEMKISASRPSGMVREYVLYGTRAAEFDKSRPEVLINREIAAIIVEESSAFSNGGKPEEGREHKYKGYFPVDIHKQGETEDYDTTVILPGAIHGLPNEGKQGERKDYDTTVILPGAIHGLPNEGAPSSLINRWKSGGLCDCGGWDIGCKLRVLIDHKEQTNFLASTKICSLVDQADISKQDGEKKKPSIFCLTPFKDGYCSVHFNPSLSHLEAFSISVAVLTSKRLLDILDVINVLTEGNLTADGMPANEKNSNPKVFHCQVPAKYLSSPPLSPAGRI